ncbi:MAG: LPS export ABC transporter periplasmic protein LptC [Bacteroidota bacterium]
MACRAIVSGERRRRLALLLAFVAGVNLHCAPDPEVSDRFRRPLEVGVDQMEDVDWWFYNQGKAKAHAVAGKASWQRSQNRLEFYEGLEVVFYDATGRKVVSRLRALGGSRDTKKSVLEAKGRVVTNNLAGDTLFTEHLLMDEATGRVYTNGPVRIRTPREELRGEGLEANRDLSQYRILRLKGSVRWGGRS